MDPSLTDGGKLQARLLAQHFRDRMISFTRVFSSDLDRASRTAELLCQQQLGAKRQRLAPVSTPALREQQLSASLEGTRWHSGAPASSISRPDALRGGGEPVYSQEESLESMMARADAFLREHILPLMAENSFDEDVVAIVGHGIMLQALWLSLSSLFDAKDRHYGPEIDRAHLSDRAMPVWSNTGYMELDIRLSANAPQLITSGTSAPLMLAGAASRSNSRGSASSASSLSAAAAGRVPLSGWSLTVLTIDETKHLASAQMARTGDTVTNTVGGSRQQLVDQFYRLAGTA